MNPTDRSISELGASNPTGWKGHKGTSRHAPQQILGNGSPTSISTILDAPSVVFMTTRPG